MQNPPCLFCLFVFSILFHNVFVPDLFFVFIHFMFSMYTVYCYCLLKLFCFFVFFYNVLTHIPLPDFPWEPGFWSFQVKDCEKEIQRKYVENIKGCRRLWKRNPMERWSANKRMSKMFPGKNSLGQKKTKMNSFSACGRKAEINCNNCVYNISPCFSQGGSCPPS